MSTALTNIGLLDDEEIILDMAALTLSQEDHVSTDTDQYTELLDRIEERLRDHSKHAYLNSERGKALVDILYGEFDFTGDVEGYDAPVNADFIRVLDRRRGLPISLAIVYIAMARRLGWPAYMLNTPGHVLMVLGDDEQLIIDPFSNGVIMPQARLVKHFQSMADVSDDRIAEILTPMTNRAILNRLLLNQAFRAEQTKDFSRALAIYRRMIEIVPDNADAWWEAARLHLLENDTQSARFCLTSMLEVTRSPMMRKRIADALAKLGTDGDLAAG